MYGWLEFTTAVVLVKKYNIKRFLKKNYITLIYRRRIIERDAKPIQQSFFYTGRTSQNCDQTIRIVYIVLN